MATRTDRRTVTISQSFRLDGIDGELPPGRYEVDTDEETIDGLSFISWRRTATMIHVRRSGTTQVFRIDPADLDECLLRETDAAGAPR